MFRKNITRHGSNRCCAVRYSDNELTVQVPTQFFYEYLEEHFADILQRTLLRVFGSGIQLMYSISVVKEPKETIDLPGGGTGFAEIVERGYRAY